VLLGVDTMIDEELSEMIALVMFDDIEMVDMTVAGQFRGKAEAVALEAVGVALGPGAALISPLADVLELDAEERGVKIIEAAIEAEGVHRAFQGSVIAHAANGQFDVGAIGNEGATVAKGAEIFLDDEAGANRVAEFALLEAAAVSVDGLGVIFNDPELVLFGDGADGLHVGAMAVEMHGNDADGARRDGGFDLRGIDIVGDRVGIDEHSFAAGNPDGFGGGEKSVGGGDHFVAGLDTEGEKGEPESVGAGVQADGMLHAKILGQLLFKASESGAHNISLAFHDGMEGVVDFAFDAVVLTGVAVKRNFQFCRYCGRRHSILLAGEKSGSKGSWRSSEARHGGWSDCLLMSRMVPESDYSSRADLLYPEFGNPALKRFNDVNAGSQGRVPVSSLRRRKGP